MLSADSQIHFPDPLVLTPSHFLYKPETEILLIPGNEISQMELVDFCDDHFQWAGTHLIPEGTKMNSIAPKSISPLSALN